MCRRNAKTMSFVVGNVTRNSSSSFHWCAHLCTLFLHRCASQRVNTKTHLVVESLSFVFAFRRYFILFFCFFFAVLIAINDFFSSLALFSYFFLLFIDCFCCWIISFVSTNKWNVVIPQSAHCRLAYDTISTLAIDSIDNNEMKRNGKTLSTLKYEIV